MRHIRATLRYLLNRAGLFRPDERQVRGVLWPGHLQHSKLRWSPSAKVAADVVAHDMSDGRLAIVEFMVDTGADFTTLGPSDADNVLGSEHYESLDFNDAERTVPLNGIGKEPVLAFLLDASLTFRDKQRQPISIPLVIAVIQPVPSPGERNQRRAGRLSELTPDGLGVDEPGTWWMPSLLGRDVLHSFDLWISYRREEVVLTKTPPSS